MICIIDYGMGNLRSVQKKLLRLNPNIQISGLPSVIEKANKLILPGVGHFANGMSNLKKLGIKEILNKRVLVEKTPILGICLGMQLMSKYSEEGNTEGLGWFDADVVRFNINNKLNYKVPHIGWNSAKFNRDSQLFFNVPNEALFYFVHSYHIKCNNSKDILTTTEYEYEFTSSIQKDNIYGTQFHPEKSHDIGEIVFKNFLNL